jgi:hypothetical protein
MGKTQDQNDSDEDLIDDPKVYDSADDIEDDGPKADDSESSYHHGTPSENSEEQDIADISVEEPIPSSRKERAYYNKERAYYYLAELALIFKYGMALDPRIHKDELLYWSMKVPEVARARKAQHAELGLPLHDLPNRTGTQLQRRWVYLQEFHKNGMLELDDDGTLIGFGKGQFNKIRVLKAPNLRSLGLSWTATEEILYEKYLGDPEKIAEQFLKPLDEGEGGEMPVATSMREIKWHALLKYFPARTAAMLKAHHAKRLREGPAHVEEVAKMSEADKDRRAIGNAGRVSTTWVNWSAKELITLAKMGDKSNQWSKMAKDPVFAEKGRTWHGLYSTYRRHFKNLDPEQREEKLKELKNRLRYERAARGEDPDEAEVVEEAEQPEEVEDSASVSASAG